MLSIDFYTPPLRFALQNIGEVARSDGGVNPYSKKTYEIFSTPLPLLIVDEIGGVPVGRGGG